MSRIGQELRTLLWKASVKEEVDAELQFHLDMRIREYVAEGMSEEEARGKALAKLGDLGRIRAECEEQGQKRDRETARASWFSALGQDTKYAVRQLRRSPGFTAVATLTLTLGIGATSAIFSLVWAVVLKPLPYVEGDRTVAVQSVWRGNPGGVATGNFGDWRARATKFSHLAAQAYTSFNLSDDVNSPERAPGERVTRGWFDIFRVRPVLGRTFTVDEDVPGANRVVLLAQGLWKRRFGGDPTILGRAIRLSGDSYTVVGILPADFDPTMSETQIWVPLALTPEQLAFHDEHFLRVHALLRPGVSPAQAQSEMVEIARQLEREFPRDNKDRTARVVPIQQYLLGDTGQKMWLLLGSVLLVLVIACVNVGNLLLSRGTGRARELAVRAALGAGHSRIVRQLLTESVVLGLVGGVAGLLLAAFLVKALIAASPPDVPRLSQATLDGTVLAFTALLALGSSLFFGLVPSIKATRRDLHGTLQHGAAAARAGRDRTRTVLVIVEVALASTLLVGAGLLVRTALFLTTVDPGFRPNGLLTARLTLPPGPYASPEAASSAFRSTVARLQDSPGIAAAAAVTQAPLGSGGTSNGLFPEGQPPDHVVLSMLRVTTPGYLKAMGIPLLKGRFIDDTDVPGSERVMVVSESLARLAFPGEDPIGKRISCCEITPDGKPNFKTVIGVVGDVRWQGPAESTGPEFYLPMAQAPPLSWKWNQRSMTLVARSADGNAASAVPALRAAVAQVDAVLPLYDVSSMEERLHEATATSRFLMRLLAALGLFGLLLAAVGVYGVVAYGVAQRTREIGVRMALGATAGQVLALTARGGLRPVALGLVTGLFLSVGATRALGSVLRGVSATDPLTFAGVGFILLLASAIAVYVPSRRAARVDPARALVAE
ncbi:MAG: ADOP family duplicated permease [Myxococcales bacterium]